MDISTQHCAKGKAKVSSFLFGCVGRILYILELCHVESSRYEGNDRICMNSNKRCKIVKNNLVKDDRTKEEKI